MKKGETLSMRWFRPMQVFLFVLLGVFSFSQAAHAAPFGINFFIVDGEEQPINEPIDVRVSLWDAVEVSSGDINGSGNINTSAPNYGGYQIVVDYDEFNTAGFVEVNSSNLSGFPTITPDNYIAQVEWKLDGAANTTYQLVDFSTYAPFDSNDRYVLSPEGGISYNVIDFGPYSSFDSVVIDSDNDASGAISLVFGQTLAKSLSYNLSAGRFELNDDLNVAGALTVNGNAVDTTKDVDNLYINRNTSNASYATLGEFIYSGTSTEGAITAMNVVASFQTLATSYSLRVYDVTNAQVIAEVTGLTTIPATMQNLGTVSNLPSGPAIFQLQAKRVGGLLQLVTVSTWQIIH